MRLTVPALIASLAAIAPVSEARSSNSCSRQEAAAVIQTMVEAHKLERSLYEKADRVKTKNMIYHHFRSRFGHSLSRRLADHYWDESTGKLAWIGEYQVPTNVKPQLLSCRFDQATAYWIDEPDDARHQSSKYHTA